MKTSLLAKLCSKSNAISTLERRITEQKIQFNFKDKTSSNNYMRNKKINLSHLKYCLYYNTQSFREAKCLSLLF